jgi:hypothetical protein
LKSSAVPLFVAALLIVSLACSVSSGIVPTRDPNSIGTAVAGTLLAASSQTAPGGFPIASAPATSTFTLEPPTSTVTPSPTVTFTPGAPQITVSVATNCRVGPGTAYDRVGALLADEVTEVYGRDPTGRYWYIRNPDAGLEFCWMWGEYANLIGDTARLPIFTPPPTPTPLPSFEAAFDNLDTCIGWWADLRLKNTGTLAFKSVSITLRDLDNDTVVAMSVNGFTDNDGCSGSSTRDSLDPGSDRVVSAPSFTYNPSGHNLRATVTLCSGTGQSGECVSQVINFKP